MSSFSAHANKYFPQDEATWNRVTEQIVKRVGSEDVSDVLIGSAYLAKRRAQLLNRPAQLEDLEFALSIFCHWPLKPDPPPEVRAALLELRRTAFEGASRGSDEAMRAALDRLVPDSTLMLAPEELHARQRASVDAFLKK